MQFRRKSLSFGYPKKCPSCKHHIFCQRNAIVILTFRQYLDYRTIRPCELAFYDSIIGICFREDRDYCEKDLCPYCPASNWEFCEKHAEWYYTNAYFKGNGVCCWCLEKFKREHNVDTVLMVRHPLI